jgi:AraC-like DNA-binding protein/quercetin dioxygenase-like cupin family protein
VKLTDKHCELTYMVYDKPQKDDFQKHLHLDYELLYVVRGEAEYHIEAQSFTLRPHDLVFIPPNQYHYLRPLSDQPYERYVINFEPRILPGENQARVDDLPTVVNIENNRILRDCFEKLGSYATRFEEQDARLMLRCALREILLNLLYEMPRAEGGRIRHNLIIDRITALIDAYPERNWNAETLAAELFLSKSHLQNTFSRCMDIGLKNYINNKKILYAQSLLLAGDRPADVCEACGFHDYSTFYRLYRKITGTTPTSTGRE